MIGGGAVGVETAIYIASKGTITGETLKFLFMHDAEDVETLRQLCTKGSHEVTVLEMCEDVIKLDANHPLAGKPLNFDIELVSIG